MEHNMVSDYDLGYEDGKDDLAEKLLNLIWGYDYEITAEEIEEFIDAERTWKPDKVQ